MNFWLSFKSNKEDDKMSHGKPFAPRLKLYGLTFRQPSTKRLIQFSGTRLIYYPNWRLKHKKDVVKLFDIFQNVTEILYWKEKKRILFVTVRVSGSWWNKRRIRHKSICEAQLNALCRHARHVQFYRKLKLFPKGIIVSF